MTQYTPMIDQYLEIKKLQQDAILFFRLGDFYEMFFEDAHTASRELEIVLTGRDAGQEERIPMCGIPYHAAAGYIARLVSRGYKIAICEQVEDPKQARGIVRREVIKIITPGTITDDMMLDQERNNYLAAVVEDKDRTGLAYIDVSTGEFMVTEFAGPEAPAELGAEIQRLSPSECLLPASADLYSSWKDNPVWPARTSLSTIAEEAMHMEKAQKILLKHFQLVTLESYGLNEFSAGIKAAAGIIVFLQETQKCRLEHIQSLKSYHPEHYVVMDAASRRNLELTASLRESRKAGTLLSVLDRCQTAMGKRLLRRDIEQPLRNPLEIDRRLDCVAELVENLVMREQLGIILDRIYDMERLSGKLGSGIAHARDILALKQSCRSLAEIVLLLQGAGSVLLQQAAAMDQLGDLAAAIEEAVNDEAPLSLKEGGLIKTGYMADIDELRNLSRQGSQWLVEFEAREKERTGIKYLKVGFNKVFGYYLEISKSNLHMVPADYVRKQTLVNVERYICDELKHYEDKILGARERLFDLEYQTFIHIRSQLAEHIQRIQASAAWVARLDVFYALSECAYRFDYIRPTVDGNGRIEIRSGRHPVVEHFLDQARFVPNDVRLNEEDARFLLITGPNMGGKSTYMRQAALILIMAQIGSFVPAESAHIGVADRIFTRVGAADDLASGQSTFMVEMVEVANILNNATEKSLVILDEIGRGTSTFDGLSLARAVSEHLVLKIKARTLFATHYHELTTLADEHAGIVNLSVSVRETGNTVVFLKKVLPGKADKSYGIHVARLAGIPGPVIGRAESILAGLESPTLPTNITEAVRQPVLFDMDQPVVSALKELDIDRLTPRQALEILYRWKDEIS